MKKAFLLTLLLLCSNALLAQVAIVQNGQDMRIFSSTNQTVQCTAKIGEEFRLLLGENPLQGTFWRFRGVTPAGVNAVIQHTFQEGYGRQAGYTSQTTLTMSADMPVNTVIELVLCGVNDAAGLAPQSVLRCNFIVNPQLAPLPPRPAPLPVPIPGPQTPIPQFRLEEDCFYSLDSLPATAEARVRPMGGELEFYLENRRKEGLFWSARYDAARLEVEVDNDEDTKVFLPGHKNARERKCTGVEITGKIPGTTQVVLELRRRGFIVEPPVRTFTIQVKVH